MTHSESQLQQSCVCWFRYQYPRLTLFAIPNGGRRGKIEAGIMKGEGVLAGVADLFLMVPSPGRGLFIEMKAGKGKQSDSQIEFEKQCKTWGYGYVVCRNFEEFKNVVEKHLNQ